MFVKNNYINPDKSVCFFLVLEFRKKHPYKLENVRVLMPMDHVVNRKKLTFPLTKSSLATG